MTEKQQFMELVDSIHSSGVKIEDVLFTYMRLYPEDFPPSRTDKLAKTLLDTFVFARLDYLEQVRYVASERARYLKRYLEGKMYANEEEAKRYVDVQLENAKAIVEACEVVK